MCRETEHVRRYLDAVGCLLEGLVPHKVLLVVVQLELVQHRLHAQQRRGQTWVAAVPKKACAAPIDSRCGILAAPMHRLTQRHPNTNHHVNASAPRASASPLQTRGHMSMVGWSAGPACASLGCGGSSHLQLLHRQVRIQLQAEELLHLVEVGGVEAGGEHRLIGGLRRVRRYVSAMLRGLPQLQESPAGLGQIHRRRRDTTATHLLDACSHRLEAKILPAVAASARTMRMARADCRQQRACLGSHQSRRERAAENHRRVHSDVSVAGTWTSAGSTRVRLCTAKALRRQLLSSVPAINGRYPDKTTDNTLAYSVGRFPCRILMRCST